MQNQKRIISFFGNRQFYAVGPQEDNTGNHMNQ